MICLNLKAKQNQEVFKIRILKEIVEKLTDSNQEWHFFIGHSKDNEIADEPKFGFALKI
jgi:hypothetical protein